MLVSVNNIQKLFVDVFKSRPRKSLSQYDDNQSITEELNSNDSMCSNNDSQTTTKENVPNQSINDESSYDENTDGDLNDFVSDRNNESENNNRLLLTDMSAKEVSKCFYDRYTSFPGCFVSPQCEDGTVFTDREVAECLGNEVEDKIKHNKEIPLHVSAEETGYGEIIIRPGNKLYSEIANPVRNIGIVSDSMTNGINRRNLNSRIDCGRDDIKLMKFPGTNTNQLLHYSEYTLKHDNLNSIVIMCGTNDLTITKTPDVKEIANRLVRIGINAKNMGVENVFIAGIIIRRNKYFHDLIRKLNILVKLMCIENNFYFIDNSNICVGDLAYDGLHLNRNGSEKLASNILFCVESYNPYLDQHY